MLHSIHAVASEPFTSHSQSVFFDLQPTRRPPRSRVENCTARRHSPQPERGSTCLAIASSKKQERALRDEVGGPQPTYTVYTFHAFSMPDCQPPAHMCFRIYWMFFTPDFDKSATGTTRLGLPHKKLPQWRAWHSKSLVQFGGTLVACQGPKRWRGGCARRPVRFATGSRWPMDHGKHSAGDFCGYESLQGTSRRRGQTNIAWTLQHVVRRNVPSSRFDAGLFSLNLRRGRTSVNWPGHRLIVAIPWLLLSPEQSLVFLFLSQRGRRGPTTKHGSLRCLSVICLTA